eukprot:g20132.t1
MTLTLASLVPDEDSGTSPRRMKHDEDQKNVWKYDQTFLQAQPTQTQFFSMVDPSDPEDDGVDGEQQVEVEKAPLEVPLTRSGQASLLPEITKRGLSAPLESLPEQDRFLDSLKKKFDSMSGPKVKEAIALINRLLSFFTTAKSTFWSFWNNLLERNGKRGSGTAPPANIKNEQHQSQEEVAVAVPSASMMHAGPAPGSAAEKPLAEQQAGKPVEKAKQAAETANAKAAPPGPASTPVHHSIADDDKGSGLRQRKGK